MSNKIIFRCQFGSHVYGTNLPTSDLDMKSIFIPGAHDLIMQRAAKHIQNNTKKDSSTRNLPTDIDDEAFSIASYLKLLCEGQTVALDMLFTPTEFLSETSDTWRLIVKNKDRFLHKGTSSFVGYTRTQAAKYGVKGFRVAALRECLDILKGFDSFKRVEEYREQLHRFVSETEHTAITSNVGTSGENEFYLEVCNRKVPFLATVKYATQVFQRVFDQYGHRAMMAENNEGIDWKALMHAVRVAREAEELLLTGHITFPRPEKQLLLQIRKGELPYNTVAPIIEEGLVRIEEAQIKSTLPAKPDFSFAESMIYSAHYETLFSWMHTTQFYAHE